MNTTGVDFAPVGLEMIAMLVPPITLVAILPGELFEPCGEDGGTTKKGGTKLVGGKIWPEETGIF